MNILILRDRRQTFTKNEVANFAWQGANYGELGGYKLYIKPSGEFPPFPMILY
jgi:hypothetical protein